MVEKRLCTFCGGDVEPGTGKMYVKKDGSIYFFCKSKCQKNMLGLKRVPRRTRWSEKYELTVEAIHQQRLAEEKDIKKPVKKAKKEEKKPVKKTSSKKPAKDKKAAKDKKTTKDKPAKKTTPKKASTKKASKGE